jgi:hypothetical protein
MSTYEGAVEKAHGRIERRSIDVLPANAAGIENDWSSVKHICRVTRFRQGKKNGQWNEPDKEVVYLIARFPNGEASPEALLSANRGHWGIEIMHRNKDVILEEDGYTNGENPFLRTQLQCPDHRAIVIESGGRGHLIYRLAFHQDPLRFEQTSQRIPLGRRSLP